MKTVVNKLLLSIHAQMQIKFYNQLALHYFIYIHSDPKSGTPVLIL